MNAMFLVSLSSLLFLLPGYGRTQDGPEGIDAMMKYVESVRTNSRWHPVGDDAILVFLPAEEVSAVAEDRPAVTEDDVRAMMEYVDSVRRSPRWHPVGDDAILVFLPADEEPADEEPADGAELITEHMHMIGRAMITFGNSGHQFDGDSSIMDFLPTDEEPADEEPETLTEVPADEEPADKAGLDVDGIRIMLWEMYGIQ